MRKLKKRKIAAYLNLVGQGVSFQKKNDIQEAVIVDTIVHPTVIYCLVAYEDKVPFGNPSPIYPVNNSSPTLTTTSPPQGPSIPWAAVWVRRDRLGFADNRMTAEEMMTSAHPDIRQAGRLYSLREMQKTL